MEDNNWVPERVLAELRANASGSTLDDSDIAGLVSRALFLIGRGHAELEPELDAFYGEFAGRIGADARRQIFDRFRDHARSGLLASGVVVHFLRLETERGIVAEAAFDTARIGVPAPAGEARGADYVLELVVRGAVANPGAALAGLLALACDDVNAKLRLLRPALARCEADAALAEMTRHAREHVHVATVEFWLEWMESLVASLPGAQRVFERAADALVTQRHAIRGQVVFDGSWIAPPQHGTPEDVAGSRELPLGRYAASVTPRLAALAAAAPESSSLRRALAAWMLVH